jgi:protocatechuate 3,4-dioxygenase beta subunit
MATSNLSINNLTIDNLTPHVINLSSNIQHERLKFVFGKLIQYSHDFVRETKLTTAEWEAAWQYLTDVGKFCTADRQEMILLSDVLGISALVDAINTTASGATESSVLGPFHNHAHEFENGQSIASKGAIGEPMLIRGTVSDTDGKPLEGAAVDVWETNGNGFYDMQDPEKDEPDCRGIFHTDQEGRFALVGVRCVDYPIPFDGPVGVLLRLLNRSNVRPAHVVSSRAAIDVIELILWLAFRPPAPEFQKSDDSTVLPR